MFDIDELNQTERELLAKHNASCCLIRSSHKSVPIQVDSNQHALFIETHSKRGFFPNYKFEMYMNNKGTDQAVHVHKQLSFRCMHHYRRFSCVVKHLRSPDYKEHYNGCHLARDR